MTWKMGKEGVLSGMADLAAAWGNIVVVEI